MDEQQKIRLISYLYLCSWPFFFIMSKLRNNMEFIFFYGMIDSLVVLQFSRYLKVQPLAWIFPLATFVTMLSGFFLFPEGITLIFPFLALILINLSNSICMRWYKRIYSVDLLFSKGSDRLYTFVISAINLSIWLLLIMQFSFNHAT